MNIQNLSTLQLFQGFSPKSKSRFLQSRPKEFFRFFCEGIVNLLKRNLESIKRYHVAKFQKNWFFFPKRTTWKQTRDLLASQNGWQLIKILTTAVISNWLDMEQFNFVNVSLYNNKSLSTHSVTKSKLAKFQVGENAVYQINLLRREKIKKFFCRSRDFSRQIFVLSMYQGLEFADFTNGWCRNWGLVVRLCSTTASKKCRSSRHLLDAAGITPNLVLKHNAETKERLSWNVRSCRDCTLKVQVLLLMDLWHFVEG